MGFLLTGVLTDYKESERLPGELAASIESITEENLGNLQEQKCFCVQRVLDISLSLTVSIKIWF